MIYHKHERENNMKIKSSKKYTACVLAVSLLTFGTAMTSGAELNISSADMINLQNALVNLEEINSDQDINNDGYVNIFDLCMMKNQLHKESQNIKDMIIPINDTYVKFTGRHILKDNTEWLLQSGSATEFTVTGTKASVTISGDRHADYDEDYRPRYAVFVDDMLILDKTIDSKEEIVTLLDGDKSRTASIRIMLLSEAANGPVGVSSINVSSGVSTPVKPSPKKDLLIEFIGDSITCAYGVEGKSSSESFKTTTENFSKSYAYLAARQLNADYSVVSYSGHGIVSGYSSGDKNSDQLVPDFYTLSSKVSDYDDEWDFSQNETDAVFINLGTNDINYVTSDYDTRSEEFTEAYTAFLKTIRKKNPKAAIICTMGVMGGGDEIYPLIEKAVENFKAETGDTNIIYFESAVHNITADGVGSDWHPSETTQINNGYIAADKICKALGIESSGTGLDAAADGAYDVVCDKDSGAYAAFYVGYDKSLWINTTEGGTSSTDIEATISGIELKAGGKYQLTFDCTATPETDIPVLVTGKSEYFSAVAAASGDGVHFDETFTIPEKDTNAKIVFRAGGMSYQNITIRNLKLVKIN